MARLAAAAASALFLLLISVCTADDLPTGPFSKGVFEVRQFASSKEASTVVTSFDESELTSKTAPSPSMVSQSCPG